MDGIFITIQRDLPTRLKRKVHAIGGSRGVWSLSVRPGSKSGSLHPGRSGIHDDDSIIVSTDATPSPGLSRVCAYLLARWLKFISLSDGFCFTIS